MKNSKFLFDFLNNEIKDVVVFVHSNKDEKLNSDVIYLTEDNVNKIESNKSEQFLTTFMDCLKNKVSNKSIVDIDIQLDELMKIYQIKTKDNGNICLISRHDLENKYYIPFMKFIDEKRKKDYYVEFVRSLFLDNIKKFNIHQSETNCGINTTEDNFYYNVSKKLIEDENELETIRNMINMIIKNNPDNKFKINSSNYSDNNSEKFNINITKMDGDTSIINIKGVNLIKRLEYKGE